MNKSILILLTVSLVAIFGIAIIGDVDPTGLGTRGGSRTCVDSDGGQNLLEAGTVTYTRGSRTRTYVDECEGDSKIKEWFCDLRNRAKSTKIDCPDDTLCLNGACVPVVQATPTPPPTPPVDDTTTTTERVTALVDCTANRDAGEAPCLVFQNAFNTCINAGGTVASCSSFTDSYNSCFGPSLTQYRLCIRPCVNQRVADNIACRSLKREYESCVSQNPTDTFNACQHLKDIYRTCERAVDPAFELCARGELSESPAGTDTTTTTDTTPTDDTTGTTPPTPPPVIPTDVVCQTDADCLNPLTPGAQGSGSYCLPTVEDLTIKRCNACGALLSQQFSKSGGFNSDTGPVGNLPNLGQNIAFVERVLVGNVLSLAPLQSFTVSTIDQVTGQQIFEDKVKRVCMKLRASAIPPARYNAHLGDFMGNFQNSFFSDTRYFDQRREALVSIRDHMTKEALRVQSISPEGPPGTSIPDCPSSIASFTVEYRQCSRSGGTTDETTGTTPVSDNAPPTTEQPTPTGELTYAELLAMVPQCRAEYETASEECRKITEPFIECRANAATSAESFACRNQFADEIAEAGACREALVPLDQECTGFCSEYRREFGKLCVNHLQQANICRSFQRAKDNKDFCDKLVSSSLSCSGALNVGLQQCVKGINFPLPIPKEPIVFESLDIGTNCQLEFGNAQSQCRNENPNDQTGYNNCEQRAIVERETCNNQCRPQLNEDIAYCNTITDSANKLLCQRISEVVFISCGRAKPLPRPNHPYHGFTTSTTTTTPPTTETPSPTTLGSCKPLLDVYSNCRSGNECGPEPCPEEKSAFVACMDPTNGANRVLANTNCIEQAMRGYSSCYPTTAPFPTFAESQACATPIRATYDACIGVCVPQKISDGQLCQSLFDQSQQCRNDNPNTFRETCAKIRFAANSCLGSLGPNNEKCENGEVTQDPSIFGNAILTDATFNVPREIPCILV